MKNYALQEGISKCLLNTFTTEDEVKTWVRKFTKWEIRGDGSRVTTDEQVLLETLAVTLWMLVRANSSVNN